MDELRAWLTLARAPGMHGGVLTELLPHCHSAAGIVTATAASLRSVGLEQRLIDGLQGVDGTLVDQDLHWLDGAGQHFIPWGDSRYPTLLAQLRDAPVGLYVRGNPAMLA